MGAGAGMRKVVLDVEVDPWLLNEATERIQQTLLRICLTRGLLNLRTGAQAMSRDCPLIACDRPKLMDLLETCLMGSLRV